MPNLSYRVMFIEDHQLPGGVAWIFLRTPTEFVLAIKASQISEQTMADAWAAYRELAAEPAPPEPRTRARVVAV